MRMFLVSFVLLAFAAPMSAQTVDLPEKIRQLQNITAQHDSDVSQLKADLAALKADVVAMKGQVSVNPVNQPQLKTAELSTSYVSAYQTAFASKIPLVVGADAMPPAGAGYLCCQTSASDKVPVGKIVVTRPGADGMYIVTTLPGTASAADIQKALGAGMNCNGVSCTCAAMMGGCTCGSPATPGTGGMTPIYGQPAYGYAPVTYGGFQGFTGGGCQGGNCGTQSGFTGFAPMRGGIFGGARRGTCGPNGCN